MDKIEYHELCFRCESRAKFLETKMAPRSECSQINKAVTGCYMYSPVIPVILKKNKNDDRPQFAGYMISARSHGVKLPITETEIVLDIKEFKDGNMLFWVPKNKKNKK
jgi:hypothetical protein